MLKPLGGLSAKAAALAEASIARALEVLADPQQGLAGTIANARLGAKVMGDVAAMALMADDSPTLLKGKPSGDKRVAWGEPIALADVKAIGKALGGSINDVLLASVAGAIGALAARSGRRSGGQGDPRHGAGQPAPARRRRGSSATASAWRRSCCRSASRTRSSASSPFARA